MSFDAALAIILEHEGGFVDHPLDKGGATKQGVTQRVYDAYRMTSGKPTRTVREIDGSEVAEIYRNQYWRAVRADELPEKLALVMFDAAVNHGPRKAITLLQRALGVSDDGVFGPATVQALESAMDTLPEASIAARCLAEREDLYDSIIADNPSQAVFARGWSNRISSLLERIA
jgi:lysozyme family protein